VLDGIPAGRAAVASSLISISVAPHSRYGTVMLHSPSDVYGRAGHATVELTVASANVRTVPAVVDRKVGLRANQSLVMD